MADSEATTSPAIDRAAQLDRTAQLDRAAQIGAALVTGRDPWAAVPSSTARTIILAGISAFAERGFHGTNLRRITDGTGLSTAALYVHFSSKEDLLFEISRRGYLATAEIIREAVDRPDPLEALQVLVYAFTRWQAEQHTTARVVFYQDEALSAEHAAELRTLRRGCDQRIRTLVEQGIADGTFRSGDPRGISAALLSLSVDVARWYGPHAPYSPDELGRLYCELAGRMLGVAG